MLPRADAAAPRPQEASGASRNPAAQIISVPIAKEEAQREVKPGERPPSKKAPAG